MSVSAAIFDTNAAASRGGGVSTHYVAQLALVGGHFTGGVAANGSGLALSSEHTYDPNYAPPWINPLYSIPDITQIYPTTVAGVQAVEFTRNSATAYGGGVHLTARAAAAFYACAMENNSAVAGGGGLAADDVSSAALAGGSLDRNTAGGSGGGAHLLGSSNLAATAAVITRNHGSYGGGIYVGDDSDAALEDCTVEANTASACGGGFAVNSSRPVAMSGFMRITGNSATGDGGAVCALRSDGFASACTPLMAVFPFLCAVATGATVAVQGNAAGAGGGAFVAECTAPGAATAAMWAAGTGSYTDTGGGLWQIDRNIAAYGSLAATKKVALEVLSLGGTNDAYAPGDVLAVKLRLRDEFNQTVRPAASASLPFELVLSLPDRADVSPSSFFCEMDGICSAVAAGVRIPWPATGGGSSGGMRAFAPWVDVRFDYRTTPGEAALEPAAVRLMRAPCGSGTAYDATMQVLTLSHRTRPADLL